jgi:aryl-alcohol dehydrogenase-like predicted oxidoreductase
MKALGTWEMCGRKPRLTPAQAEQLRAYHRQGFRYIDLASMFGISIQSVGVYLRREHKRRELR